MSASLDNPKLASLAAAVARRDALRDAGKTVVLTNGVFDLLHAGHVYSLQWAGGQGDALFVAVNGDDSVRRLKGPTRPVVDQWARAYALGALACVHTVVIFDTPRLTDEIGALRPDVYCKAGDYTRETLDPGERAALDAAGVRAVFAPFLPGFSTTRLIARIQAAGAV